MVIMSRSEEKLQKVADEISELFLWRCITHCYMIPYNFKGTAMPLFSIRAHSNVPLSDIIWYTYTCSYLCGGTIDCSTVSGMSEVCLNHHVFTNVGVLCLVV